MKTSSMVIALLVLALLFSSALCSGDTSTSGVSAAVSAEAAEASETQSEAAESSTEAQAPAEAQASTDAQESAEGELPPFIVEMLNPTIPEVREGVKHVACVGDSITWGAGVIIPDMNFGATYPVFLEAELGEGYQVLNYGMGGRTLLKEGDDPYVEENFYEISHDVGADIYVIMLGTNDSKPYNWNADLYREELEAFVRSYMELSNGPKIYLMTPPRAFVVDGAETIQYDIQNDVINDEVRPIVKEVAELLGVNLIDMYEATEDHPEWFPDGVHPDDAGNQEFAKIVAAHLDLN